MAPKDSPFARPVGAPLVRCIATERFSVELVGLSEAAPGYVAAALFDPYVVGSSGADIALYLNLADTEPGAGMDGLGMVGVLRARDTRGVLLPGMPQCSVGRAEPAVPARRQRVLQAFRRGPVE